ncbi:sugar phosphate isomerase/epimerase [Spiractinospora alimapuensis]|uniref:sugar phosphate isomerase/epimerase family protein n=1 Tax=Spiractinospora alimapuensis TaxID=2820884 RepID=UPI0022AB091C|nr:sugar phosphate isomerase/epimerase family protein [Spiractinospora alimapuensis]QVQ54504.1 sugar phosphate isomerase/epimerase [Spiractinospora alimapuensis]
MLPGVYSISLPDMSPSAAVDAVRRAGYAGIEWRVGSPPPPSAPPDFFSANHCTLAPEPDVMESVASQCAEAGLTVIGLCPYVEFGDTVGVEHAMRLARAAGAPMVRVRAPWRDGTSFTSLFDRARAHFADLADLAGRTGVRAVLELHQRSLCPSASLGARLVEGLDPERVGVNYDAGNLLVEGYEDHGIALEILGDHLAHVHVKNAQYVRPADGGAWTHRWSPLDDGLLDVPALLDALTAVHYGGWVSVEDFSTDRSPRETLEHNARYLRSQPAFATPAGGAR